MAAFRFADAITAGQPITLYNQGKMQRDFTYIDDVVAGVLAALDRPPAAGRQAPHRLYNLGNHRPVELRHFVAVLEQALGRRAEIRLAPLPPGDVVRTSADIAASQRDLGFEPKTPIEEGLPRFAAWYRDYHGLGDAAVTQPASSQPRVSEGQARAADAISANHVATKRRPDAAPGARLSASGEQRLAQVFDRLFDLAFVAGTHKPHQRASSLAAALLFLGELQKIIRTWSDTPCSLKPHLLPKKEQIRRRRTLPSQLVVGA